MQDVFKKHAHEEMEDNVGKEKVSFSALLQRAIDKHDARRRRNMAAFRAEQARQGKSPDEPISLIEMSKRGRGDR